MESPTDPTSLQRVLRVIPRSPEVQVVGAHTARNVAAMKNPRTIRDRTIGNLPAHTMRELGTMRATSKLAVAQTPRQASLP